jgi:hypothetical protein
MKNSRGKTMPKKKKPSQFSVIKEVKAMARERIGAPPVSKIVPDRKKKQSTAQKHSLTLKRILSEAE